MKLNRAVEFLRVSSEKQFKNGDSPDEQLESIQYLKDKTNSEIIKTFTFPESAGYEIQPLDKIYDYCLEENIDYVFLKNITRYTRHWKSYSPIFDKFSESGIKILEEEGII